MTNSLNANADKEEFIAETDLPVRSLWSRFRLMAAASIMLLLTLAGWVNRNRILYQSYQTAYGETQTVYLPDGSTVTLNAHSTLRLPRFGFGDRSREVQLAGEAFFSVHHRADNQKFIVRTATGFDVIVHGTEFNVSTYAHRANVMLSRGQVQVDYSVGATRKQLMLEPGDLVSLNQPSSPKLTRHVQPQVYSAWKEHRFVFNDMTLLEFGQLLTDTYGLRVAVPDSLDWDSKVRPIPYCAKYKPPIAAPDDRSGDNLPILRYSDVLLMYAETLNELGRTGEALPFVQQVRNRAGLTNPLTGLDKTALQTLIAKERQVEFCFENQRWYDLKRTGKAIAVMTAHGLREKALKPFLYPEAYTITPAKLLAPIPVVEVSVNKLEQNPGY